MRHVSLVLLALVLAACGDLPPATGPASNATPATPAAPAPAPDAAAPTGITHPESLADLMTSIVAAQNAGERERFVALMRSLVPTRAQLGQVLRAGPATDAFLAAGKKMTVEDGALADAPSADKPLPKTERTEVFVHAATTEELAAYVKGTTAFAEFPGGMRRFAEEVAAPGRTWYAVELREPGKADGTRITCFTRLGTKFLLVPKPWRAIPQAPEEGTPAPEEPLPATR